MQWACVAVMALININRNVALYSQASQDSVRLPLVVL